MNHKRGRPKDRRAGCLLCKPHKSNANKGSERNRRNDLPPEEYRNCVGGEWDFCPDCNGSGRCYCPDCRGKTCMLCGGSRIYWM